MLVLFESAAGYALFKLLDETKLSESDDLFRDFETPEKASKVIKLEHFEKFDDIAEAVVANLTIENDKVCTSLKKVIKKHVLKDAKAELAVADAKLGKLIKKEFGVNCVYNSSIQELTRNIRSQFTNLISSTIQGSNLAQMSLGLAHSLSRYRLKFSPDKVDTMIVQAVGLLDDVDKELNNYHMRLREWYGWHFPELSKLMSDNLAYANLVNFIGYRTNAFNLDLSAFVPEELEKEVKCAAEISMGSEITEDDIINIRNLCAQVIDMSKTRDQLYSYLKERMAMVAPNLTIMVGELVGARLIAHAGSLINLSKHPSSTVQILGAEKSLFRSLKSKTDTPKYGLIYHASLVGNAQNKHKGKMSRVLAAKASLCIRYDALSEASDNTLGLEQRAKLESRVRHLNQGVTRKMIGTEKFEYQQEKYSNFSEVKTFSSKEDSTLPVKRKRKEVEDCAVATPSSKPPKVKKRRKDKDAETEDGDEMVTPKKNEVKKEPVDKSTDAMGSDDDEMVMPKKKKKVKQDSIDKSMDPTGSDEEMVMSKKKRKVKQDSIDKSMDSMGSDEEMVMPKKRKVKQDSIDKSMDATGNDEEMVTSKKKRKVKQDSIDKSVDATGSDEEMVTSKKKRKVKQDSIDKSMDATGNDEEMVTSKKKRKVKQDSIDKSVDATGSDEEMVTSKKKRKVKHDSIDKSMDATGSDEEMVMSKKKRKVKHDSIDKSMDATGSDEEMVTSKKKRKVKHDSIDKSMDATGNDEEMVMSKKKKKVKQDSIDKSMDATGSDDNDTSSSKKKQKD